MTSNNTLERGRVYCVTFLEVPGSRELIFLSELLRLKDSVSQLPVMWA